METDDLLNTANFGTQPNLIDNMLNLCDPPMFSEQFNDEPIFSSSASDSGLSSDNLDLYVIFREFSYKFQTKEFLFQGSASRLGFIHLCFVSSQQC